MKRTTRAAGLVVGVMLAIVVMLPSSSTAADGAGRDGSQMDRPDGRQVSTVSGKVVLDGRFDYARVLLCAASVSATVCAPNGSESSFNLDPAEGGDQFDFADVTDGRYVLYADGQFDGYYVQSDRILVVVDGADVTGLSLRLEMPLVYHVRVRAPRAPAAPSSDVGLESCDVDGANCSEVELDSDESADPSGIPFDVAVRAGETVLLRPYVEVDGRRVRGVSRTLTGALDGDKELPALVVTYDRPTVRLTARVRVVGAPATSTPFEYVMLCPVGDGSPTDCAGGGRIGTRGGQQVTVYVHPGQWIVTPAYDEGRALAGGSGSITTIHGTSSVLDVPAGQLTMGVDETIRYRRTGTMRVTLRVNADPDLFVGNFVDVGIDLCRPSGECGAAFFAEITSPGRTVFRIPVAAGRWRLSARFDSVATCESIDGPTARIRIRRNESVAQRIVFDAADLQPCRADDWRR